jgi:hypothetical protein
MPRMDRNLARVLVLCMCVAGMPLPARADLATTDRIEAVERTQRAPREVVAAFLDRADVRAALERRGVTADEAHARVAALSDSEVEGLVRKIDSAPAGSGGFETVVWVAFVVFLILLITDILGFTKVFSFTRPAK